MYVVGDRVLVKTVRGESVSWEEGVVIQVVSAVTYMVKARDVHRCTHADHLRPRHTDLVKRHRPSKCVQSTPQPGRCRRTSLRHNCSSRSTRMVPGPPETPAEPNTNDTPEHEELSPSKHAQQPVPKDLAESSRAGCGIRIAGIPSAT
ncbi:hypothetical protein MTO96_046475 [Rhipicephalus appendiculatus]